VARLRIAADEDPNAQLTRRGAALWLSAEEIDRMTRLWEEVERSAAWVEQSPFRRTAYGLFYGAWDFNGPVAELLELWAEERRWSACCAWAKESSGRSVLEFGPFLPRGL